jgi:hypothetical protein
MKKREVQSRFAPFSSTECAITGPPFSGKSTPVTRTPSTTLVPFF